MGQTAKVTRENRTITVDFHNEATYGQLLDDTKEYWKIKRPFPPAACICPPHATLLPPRTPGRTPCQSVPGRGPGDDEAARLGRRLGRGLRPASTSSSAPTCPMNFAARPSVGSIPVRKSRLPVCTASEYVPNGSGGAGSWMPRSFSRCSALARPRAFFGYHLPACAPPSTCKISPVVNVASVKNKTASTTSWISPILPTACKPLRNS